MEFAKRLDNVTGSAIRAIFDLLKTPGIISLAGGNPSPESFPSEDLSALASELISSRGSTVLQYGSTFGIDSLKETVLELARKRGVEASPDEVIITSGSTQGIGLTTKIFINPGDAVLTESPSFIGALQNFLIYEANLKGIKTVEDGVDLSDLEAKIIKYRPKFIYIIPTFQNPAGRTTSAEKRKGILEICEKYGTLILEDDPYCDLRYSGEYVAPIKSYDKNNSVIYLMSFSKVISPGLRVGAAIADKRIIGKFNIAKQGDDLHTANLSQEIVEAYVHSGKYWSHIEEICGQYRKKRDAMIKKLEGFPKGVKFAKPDGGLFVWVTLPENIDAVKMFEQCVSEGVAYVPGTHFFPEGGNLNTLRLNFSMPSLDQIDEGMDILKNVIKKNI